MKGGYMIVHGSGISTQINGRYKTFTRCICISFLLVLLIPLAALCSPERLVDSSDYKDKDFVKGCISDYSNMVKGDDLDWVWISPGTVLANYRISVGKFENISEELRSSQVEGVKNTYKEILSKARGGGKDVLTADICIYEFQKFSAGKAWIPFAGAHQMQAGMGVELILKDKKGKIVAKIRDMARAGAQAEDAADESATNLKKFIGKH
jgi:hypothetical protein